MARKLSPSCAFLGLGFQTKNNPVQSWLFQVSPPPSKEAHTKASAFSQVSIYFGRDFTRVRWGPGRNGQPRRYPLLRGFALDWQQRAASPSKGIPKRLGDERGSSDPTAPNTHMVLAPSFPSPDDDRSQVKRPRAEGRFPRDFCWSPASLLAPAHTHRHTDMHTHTLGTPTGWAAPPRLSFAPRGTDRQQHE